MEHVNKPADLDLIFPVQLVTQEEPEVLINLSGIVLTKREPAVNVIGCKLEILFQVGVSVDYFVDPVRVYPAIERNPQSLLMQRADDIFPGQILPQALLLLKPRAAVAYRCFQPAYNSG